MRIPLEILETKLQVNSVFRCGGIRCSGQVTFIVDTGSPLTLLSEGDALKLKIPIRSLGAPPDEKLHIYMGGSVSALKMISKRLTLGFVTDKDQIEYIELPNICVAVGTKRDEKHKRLSQGAPSILGLDFLKEQKLLLHVDPTKESAYFEKSEK